MGFKEWLQNEYGWSGEVQLPPMPTGNQKLMKNWQVIAQNWNTFSPEVKKQLADQFNQLAMRNRQYYSDYSGGGWNNMPMSPHTRLQAAWSAMDRGNRQQNQ